MSSLLKRSLQLVGALACAAIAACGGDGAARATGGGVGSDPATGKAVQIRVLGNRADLVSDGDALTEVVLAAGTTSKGLNVTLNGTDVTSAFVQRSDGRIVGLLKGLTLGSNLVSAKVGDGKAASLTITNAPRGGPVISGPQQVPFFCATAAPQAATATTPASNGSGLSTEAVDAQCNIATEYKLYYRSTDGTCAMEVPDPSPPAPKPANPCFKPFDPSATAPTDIATTTTDTGLTVPYVVRVERGTINRGIYDIAVLVDPAKPWSSGVQPQATWNGKVNFAFGWSGGQPRRQFRPIQSWTDDNALSRGWMVAVNSMTDGLLNTNRFLAAESVMMMKEHIVDRYGEIRFTVGTGCSGGSTTAYVVSTVSPGLLDGIIVSCALLDFDTTQSESYECSLLVEAYDRAPWKALMTAAGYTQSEINEKKAAINGHVDHTACQSWFTAFAANRNVGNTASVRAVPPANRDTGTIVETVLPGQTNACQLPPALVYDPITNPNGVRCGPYDWAASIVGKVSGSPAANTPRDNTGVQYGLNALRTGKITPEEFVVVNETVGAPSRDGLPLPERAVADQAALETVYKVGLISGRSLGQVAILDLRGFDDTTIAPPQVTTAIDGLHLQWRSFAIRARLDKANGHHDNQVMWRFGRSSAGANYLPTDKMALDAMLEMDKWLTNLKNDTSATPLAQKIVQAKPASAFDYCLLTGDAAQATKVTDKAACDADSLLVPHKSPRQASGGPLTEDIIKCQLKPMDVADYAPSVMNADQLRRLQTVFPQGVCDWKKPGVAQREAAVELPFTFAAGPGGLPLPAAPSSRSE